MTPSSTRDERDRSTGGAARRGPGSLTPLALSTIPSVSAQSGRPVVLVVTVKRPRGCSLCAIESPSCAGGAGEDRVRAVGEADGDGPVAAAHGGQQHVVPAGVRAAAATAPLVLVKDASTGPGTGGGTMSGSGVLVGTGTAPGAAAAVTDGRAGDLRFVRGATGEHRAEHRASPPRRSPRRRRPSGGGGGVARRGSPRAPTRAVARPPRLDRPPSRGRASAAA